MDVFLCVQAVCIIHVAWWLYTAAQCVYYIVVCFFNVSFLVGVHFQVTWTCVYFSHIHVYASVAEYCLSSFLRCVHWKQSGCLGMVTMWLVIVVLGMMMWRVGSRWKRERGMEWWWHWKMERRQSSLWNWVLGRHSVVLYHYTILTKLVSSLLVSGGCNDSCMCMVCGWCVPVFLGIYGNSLSQGTIVPCDRDCHGVCIPSILENSVLTFISS